MHIIFVRHVNDKNHLVVALSLNVILSAFYAPDIFSISIELQIFSPSS